jgi:hypothetical protein
MTVTSDDSSLSRAQSSETGPAGRTPVVAIKIRTWEH